MTVYTDAAIAAILLGGCTLYIVLKNEALKSKEMEWMRSVSITILMLFMLVAAFAIMNSPISANGSVISINNASGILNLTGTGCISVNTNTITGNLIANGITCSGGSSFTLNGLTSSVNLLQGNNIVITKNAIANTLTISSTSSGGSGGGNVISVKNNDHSLLSSPTTGNVIISINFSNPNTWISPQMFLFMNTSLISSYFNDQRWLGITPTNNVTIGDVNKTELGVNITINQSQGIEFNLNRTRLITSGGTVLDDGYGDILIGGTYTASNGDPGITLGLVNYIPSPVVGGINGTVRVESGIITALNNPSPGTITLASNSVIAKTAAITNFCKATAPLTNNGIINVGTFLNVNAITTDVAQIQLTFTPLQGGQITVNLVPMGLTTSSVSGTGANLYPVVPIQAQKNTVITENVVLTTSIGSINYAASCYFQEPIYTKP